MSGMSMSAKGFLPFNIMPAAIVEAIQLT
jgi:hypothetical protein